MVADSVVLVAVSVLLVAHSVLLVAGVRKNGGLFRIIGGI
jgi:hypothetical protein